MCERPDECRAVLYESESVVDGPFDVRGTAQSRKERLGIWSAVLMDEEDNFFEDDVSKISRK